MTRTIVPEARDSIPPELCAEIVMRTALLAHGAPRSTGPLRLPDELARLLDDSERRAHALEHAGGGGDEARRAAAFELLAAAVSGLRLAGQGERGELRELVGDAAAAVGVSRDAAALLVFLHALRMPEVEELAPQHAIEHVLDLLVELGPAEGVSLWTAPTPARLECRGQAGDAATTRRLRSAARILLATGRAPVQASSHVRAVAVRRWEQPFGALAARSRPGATGELSTYLTEAAAALGPVIGREALYDQNAARERSLVAASERRLARLGCDLHDGPLQVIVALAAELRLARAEIASLLPHAERELVEEPFDQLAAHVEALDRSLRYVSHAVRSTVRLERPLERALRDEVDAFAARGSAAATFAVEGDVTELTTSQKIVLLRVTQEALSNVRRHSGAARVTVHLRGNRSFVQLAVADDGCGFDVEGARRKGRLGLSGVLERVHLLGGAVEIRSEPRRGTRIQATLPRWSAPADPDTAPLYAVTP